MPLGHQISKPPLWAGFDCHLRCVIHSGDMLSPSAVLAWRHCDQARVWWYVCPQRLCPFVQERWSSSSISLGGRGVCISSSYPEVSSLGSTVWLPSFLAISSNISVLLRVPPGPAMALPSTRWQLGRTMAGALCPQRSCSQLRASAGRAPSWQQPGILLTSKACPAQVLQVLGLGALSTCDLESRVPPCSALVLASA